MYDQAILPLSSAQPPTKFIVLNAKHHRFLNAKFTKARSEKIRARAAEEQQAAWNLYKIHRFKYKNHHL